MIFSIYMKAQDNEMFRLLTSGFQVVFVAAAIWASIPIITFAQTTEPVTGKVPAATKPMVTDAGSTDDGNSIHNGESAQTPLPVRPILPTEIEVEIQSRLNELRSESLDNHAIAINWLLAIIALALAVFGIVIPAAGIFGVRRYLEIETAAKTSVKKVDEHLEEAKRIVEEIKRKRDEADKMIKDMNAQTAVDDPEKASQAVESIQENPEASPISKTIALAVSLQQQGKINEAIEKWRAVAHVAEESNKDQAAVAWFSVGYLLQDEKPEDSISVYDKAIRLKPDLASAYNNRGAAKYHLGQHNDAITDYDEAIRLQPDDASAYNNRGAARDYLGRHDDAIADYNEAIRLKPDLASAYNNRGVAKANLGRHDDAIADYDEAIRLQPDHADAYNNRGSAKAHLGRYDDAIADFDEAIRLKPDHAEAYNNRGSAKDDLGRHDDAIADYDEAIRLKPDDPTTYNNRGVAKVHLGRHDDAIADYDEAIRLKPDYTNAYLNRGIANRNLGLKDEAQKDFEAVLNLARNVGNADLMAQAEEMLRTLNGDDDK